MCLVIFICRILSSNYSIQYDLLIVGELKSEIKSHPEVLNVYNQNRKYPKCAEVMTFNSLSMVYPYLLT